MKIQNKKGLSLVDAVPAVLILILIGVLVIVAVYMFTALGSSLPNVSQLKVNESGATAIAAGYTLVNASDCGFGNPSIIAAINSSTGGPIPTSNLTLTSGGVLTNATAALYGGLNITYSYTNHGPACTASTNTTVQFGTFPALVGLVGTIIFLGVVIGVLIGSFAFGGNKA